MLSLFRQSQTLVTYYQPVAHTGQSAQLFGFSIWNTTDELHSFIKGSETGLDLTPASTVSLSGLSESSRVRMWAQTP